ncbi:Wzz/FepE/Etk N-terminal domain-containing protein [Thauera sp. SDU_THAU2]|uniref:Wzz/FepE/Etk N-terminal domain-containing protein n=1 Tax=Thauera sp. SDU_THAU2 TaxID=3136633 RepID=UPI00312005C2
MARQTPHTVPINEAQRNHAPGQRGKADDFINLGEIIATLFEYKWLILAITALAISVGVFVALVSTPIYRADAMLQVEDKGKAKGESPRCAMSRPCWAIRPRLPQNLKSCAHA